MNVFLILQILFDAVLLFAILFLFHFSVNQTRKKGEDIDVLKNLQVQEMKEGLQELLLTLKQLGKEVSDNIQEQVREAENKTEIFKKLLAKLRSDLNRTQVLAEEVDAERERLESKLSAIKTAKKQNLGSSPTQGRFLAGALESSAPGFRGGKPKLRTGFRKRKTATVGFSSAIIQEVYRLADVDLGVDEIVQKTNLDRAEVQLILNLRGNRFSTPN